MQFCDRFPEIFVRILQKAMPLINDVDLKISRLSTYLKVPEEQLMFLRDAAHELIKARKVLKGSYVYAYYLEDHRILFEYMQTEMENGTELLDCMFSTRYLRTCKDDMMRTTRLVRRRRHEFIVAVNKGLIIPETPPSVRKNRKRRMPGLFGMDFDDVVKKAIFPVFSCVLSFSADFRFWKKLLEKRSLFPCLILICQIHGSLTKEVVTLICRLCTIGRNSMIVTKMLAFYYPLPVSVSTSDLLVRNISLYRFRWIPSVGITPCIRPDCARPCAKNPRTGSKHQHCSLKCKKLHELESKIGPDNAQGKIPVDKIPVFT